MAQPKKKPKKEQPAQRKRYPKWVKDLVRERYRGCRTKEDKIALANEAGIESESRLYNLASRLGVAGSDDGGRYTGESEHEVIVETMQDSKFSAKDDEYLRNEFGRRHIEDIAFHIRHSESATLYRARKLGLRNPVEYWRIEKISEWLKMSKDQLRDMREEGIEVHPLTGLNGEVEVEVIATSSVARWMQANKDKLEQLGADEFFIAEINETIEEILKHETHFELCNFLSHGHVCFNPRSRSSYGYYCTNSDRYLAGNDPLCQVKIFTIDDLAPENN